MSGGLGRELGLSPTELAALEAAVPDGLSLAEWGRHLLLSAAGQPPDDELEPPDGPPARSSSGTLEPAEVARRLDELTVKLRALGEVLAEIRDTQGEWHRAIFAEIAAHTAFPDEGAGRAGLDKAARELAATEGRIMASVNRLRDERRSLAFAGTRQGDDAASMKDLVVGRSEQHVPAGQVPRA